jgi:hypothetical protein
MTGADGTERAWYAGRCHCGGVRFSACASRRLTITVCNCSIHHMSGFHELMVPEERFKLEAGQEFLKPYRYGARIADHTFCAVCGIRPFNRPRSHPTGYFAVNARCLDLGPALKIEYVEFDGQNWEASIAAGTHVVTE